MFFNLHCGVLQPEMREFTTGFRDQNKITGNSLQQAFTHGQFRALVSEEASVILFALLQSLSLYILTINATKYIKTDINNINPHVD